MVLKFGYKHLGRGIYKPIIPIEVIYDDPDEGIPYHVLIDSGADENILHINIGQMAGIPNIDQGGEKTIGGIGDNLIKGYKHPVQIKVGGWRYKTFAVFAPTISKHGFGIVGQKGFFDFFVVKFDYSKKRVELTMQKGKKFE